MIHLAHPNSVFYNVVMFRIRIRTYIEHVSSIYLQFFKSMIDMIRFIEGSLEVKLPTIWTDEKQSREEAERRGRLEERRSEEKE